MISNQSYVKVARISNYTLRVTLTKQLEALGIKGGDKVYTAVENGRIIIEKVGE